MMKAGTLVKTNKPRIGMPKGSVGLVVRVVGGGFSYDIPIAIVKHLSSGTERRWLFRDLEAAND